MFRTEDGPNIISITYPFKLFRHTLHIWNINRTQRAFLFLRTTTALGINDRVSETFGITVQLKIVSQVVNFSGQISSILAYGRGSVMETFYQASFYMRRMVRIEVEVLASVGVFPVDLCG